MRKRLKFQEVDLLADVLAQYAKENTFIALIGELGTGKTHFTQRFAKALGIKENLKSPTFNYVLDYRSGRLPLYHFDVYRLTEAEELYEVGYEDYLREKGIILMEWANIVESELPEEYIRLELKYTEKEEEREVELHYVGNEAKEKELFDYVNFGN
ncbi:tRNA (adenosine(37)-N6)-threonylcarbamoyltransferase complex ATPase subunit type 1 TsaE [Fusobacterium necrophorum]|uniref:tRNA threonylcarbamoyladenosine biosynthesis protein TsaE n=2 Tax=Fusobacterium necrophorum TaxID=859 RepID=A0AB73BZC7_9FUSO|nr:tRNA (adenosine(37)-N6)-threonylcarbamoyltransferase complex ATPase subunit type 1 TsaE [Fusobacterium necrophorum]AYZ73952.1 tRNA (adenosine(37)-N6)-threonylcarbamoyltransferase complex ATPase subunit type 1 TsaE [Fusobacterium necrophorum]AZW10170.1 tRNA (adenosine(37)-N6)-threonylcarbamoyltransferase complex ATPase subunit type 1 TsaE [Fusobacterium necrophorum subsp. necrophorum]KDE64261.1 ATP/GTP hydrolase [Fusobacterium necrophorum BFTR-1]KDE64611.1 ATP/GTP hydrolase [Fusobacterium nec